MLFGSLPTRKYLSVHFFMHKYMRIQTDIKDTIISDDN